MQGSVDAYQSLLGQPPNPSSSSATTMTESIRQTLDSSESAKAHQQQKIVFLSDSELAEDPTKDAPSSQPAAKPASVSMASVFSPCENSSGGAIQTYKLMPIKICLSESDDESGGRGGGGRGSRGPCSVVNSVNNFPNDVVGGGGGGGGYLAGSVEDQDEDSHRVLVGGRLYTHLYSKPCVGGAVGGGSADIFIGMPRGRPIGGNGRMRRQWSQENMLKAYNAVVNQGVSLRIASTKFKVPESTLRDRLHGRVNINCTRPGPQTFFTAGEEQRIVDHVLFLHRIGYTVLRKHITETANHLLRITSRAARLSIGESGDSNLDDDVIDDQAKEGDPLLMHSASNDFVSLASAMEMQTWMSEQSSAGWKAPSSVGVPPSSKRCNLPSASWLYSFTHRWPKIKECVSMSSHHRRYVIEEEVTDSNRIAYLRALTKVLLKHKLSSGFSLSRFWLMDEASISCATHPPRLMNCQTQRLQMPYQSEFPHVTLVGAGNAVGNSVPPFLLYRGTQVYKEMVLGATKGTKFTYSETGYLSPEIFMSWLLRHFTEHSGCSPDNPVLLFYDAHLLYVTISVLEEARHKGIILFPLPPHAGDLGICASFSVLNKFRYHFSKSMNLQMCRAPADKVSNLTICPFVCSAYTKAVAAANLKEVWRTTGLDDLVSLILPELPQVYPTPPPPSQKQQQQQQQQPASSQESPKQPRTSSGGGAAPKRMPRFKVEPPNEVFEDEWDEVVALAEHTSLLTAAAAAAAVPEEQPGAASSDASPELPSASAVAAAAPEPSIPSSSSGSGSYASASEQQRQPTASMVDPLALAMAAAEATTTAATVCIPRTVGAPHCDGGLGGGSGDADGGGSSTTEADLLIDELKRQLLEFDNGVRVEVKTSRKRTKNASEAGSSESPATSSSSVSQDDGSESGSPVEKSARLSAILPADDSSAAAAADCFSSCCSVCGCLAPPTCLMVSRLTGQPVASIPPYTVIQWAQCDFCNGWLHLGTCSEERNYDTSGLFKCTVCRGQELRSTTVRSQRHATAATAAK
ncbi:hypothetical protein BOX15_Mlig034404g1 [Macrostomum lignano]|uniref:HTH psq-type domain-containing protein n=2 Tax=Macrostomum lignano TaxID=282301 RepID=A0A267FVK9_9PLAT|nr:hypothetical protein BOX15_Mlig034404g1 [Macrostomum lignano]